MTTDPFPCPQPDCALMCDGACIARARRLDDEDDEPAVPLAQGGIVSPDAQPDDAMLEAARAYCLAEYSYPAGAYRSAEAREGHIDGDARSTVAEPWFETLWRAAYERGKAEGRRQATEGWERQVAVHLVEFEPGDPPYQVDDEDHAKWHLDRGYATAVLYRRVGPWEPAEQPERSAS